MKVVQRNEMMVIQIVVDAIVIEQVLRLTGYEEEDQRHHKIHDTIEHLAIIKTIHPIQNTVCLDVEMG